MSKSIATIAVFLLISLALIAATSVGVRSWLDRPGGTAGVQMQAQVVSGPQMQVQPAGAHQNGGCHSDSSGPVSSQDY